MDHTHSEESDPTPSSKYPIPLLLTLSLFSDVLLVCTDLLYLFRLLLASVSAASEHFFVFPTPHQSPEIKDTREKLPFRILLCFSLPHNLSRFTIPSPPETAFLDAFRVLSMCYVILGHTNFFLAQVLVLNAYSFYTQVHFPSTSCYLPLSFRPLGTWHISLTTPPSSQRKTVSAWRPETQKRRVGPFCINPTTKSMNNSFLLGVHKLPLSICYRRSLRC